MSVRNVIDIEVNDTRFKDFLTLWHKYRAEIKELPKSIEAADEAWKATQESVEQTAEAAQAQVGAVDDMVAAMGAMITLLDKQEKSFRGATKASSTLVQDTKKVAENIYSATTSLIRWTGIGGALAGVFGGLLGGGGLLGIDRLASTVSDARRSALRTGTDVGGQRAFNLDFGHIVDANSVLHNVADAQSDISKQHAFGALGVNNFRGRDNAQLGAELIGKAKEILDRMGPLTEQAANARRLTTFFSMDDLRAMKALSPEEVRARAGDFGKDKGDLNLSSENQIKWQNLDRALSRAGSRIQNVLVDGLSPLATPLEELSKSVADTLDTFLKNAPIKQWMASFGEAIQHFAEYLSSPKAQADMKRLIDDLGGVADGLEKLLKFFHLVPDPDRGAPDDAYNKATADVAAKGGSVQQQGEAGEAAYGAAQLGRFKADRQDVKESVAYYKTRGWTDKQARGIVANLLDESNLSKNPLGWNDGGNAYGAGQWHADRQAAFKRLFGHDIRESDLKEQREFFDWELNHTEKAAGDRLRKTTTAGDAAAVVSKYALRPKHAEEKAKARAAIAEQLDQYKSVAEGGTDPNAKPSALAAALDKYKEPAPGTTPPAPARNAAWMAAQGGAPSGLKTNHETDKTPKVIVNINNPTGASATTTARAAAVQ